MITFEKCFLTIGLETQTPRKVDTLVVYYATPTIGSIQSWVNAGVLEDSSNSPGVIPVVRETEMCVLQRTDPDIIFKGKDILSELHDMFLNSIKELNPDTQFKITI